MLNTTVDIDALWTRLSSLPLGRPPSPTPDSIPSRSENSLPHEEEYITIKRHTRYAGQSTLEEKRVLKTSAEARLHLQETAEKERQGRDSGKDSDAQVNVNDMIPTNDDQETEEEPIQLHRPLKRQSRFEPNPAGEVKGLPAHLQLRYPRTPSSLSFTKDRPTLPGQMLPPPNPLHPSNPLPAKLNTVQKSRRDWAGYVDTQGIASELDSYGKSKASYLGRADFLSRTEALIDEERRNARLVGLKSNNSTTVRYAEA
jgi:hypothetical protein